MELAAQAVYRGADGGGVVGKVVVHGDVAAGARYGAAHFHAAARIGKRAQRPGCRCGIYPHMGGCGNGRQRVELVVRASKRPLHAPYLPALVQHGKVVRFAFGGVVAYGAAKGLHGAVGAGVQHAGDAFFQPVGDHAAAGGHGAQQVVKLALNRSQIGEDVCVVKLQIVQHGRARAVVHEFAALVEKGGVVLISLDHEIAARMTDRLPPQAGRYAKVQRHATNQKARRQAG